MKHLGHISITDKVVFVYYELEKPELKCGCTACRIKYYSGELSEYNASKREVEIENMGETSKGDWEVFSWEWDSILITWSITWMKLKNNLPCEAEVNGKAVITKIL